MRTILAASMVITAALVACKSSAPHPSPEVVATASPPPSAPPLYADDIRIICDIPNDDMIKRLGTANLDPSQRARVMAERIGKKITTDEARAFFKTLTPETMTPGARATKLRDEATRVGISSCAFADWWQTFAH